MNDPEAFGNTHMSPWTLLQGRQDLFLRRRRPRVDGERLRAFRATCCSTAARSTACDCSSPKTIEMMTHQPHVGADAAAAAARTGRQLRSWLPCRHRSGRDADARLERPVRLERHLRHELLGRSEGEAGGRDDGAEVSGADGGGDLPAARVSGARQVGRSAQPPPADLDSAST